jgi:hypothetical protein
MGRGWRCDAAHSTATTRPDSESDTPDAGVDGTKRLRAQISITVGTIIGWRR